MVSSVAPALLRDQARCTVNFVALTWHHVGIRQECLVDGERIPAVGDGNTEMSNCDPRLFVHRKCEAVVGRGWLNDPGWNLTEFGGLSTRTSEAPRPGGGWQLARRTEFIMLKEGPIGKAAKSMPKNSQDLLSGLLRIVMLAAGVTLLINVATFSEYLNIHEKHSHDEKEFTEDEENKYRAARVTREISFSCLGSLLIIGSVM